MAWHRTHGNLRPANGRRWWSRDDEGALRAANLSSPGFEESWRAGSPLDWTEFIARWQSPQPLVGLTDPFAVARNRGAGK